MTLEETLNGKIIKNEKGSLLVVERKLQELGFGEVQAYIEQNKHFLTLENIRRRLQKSYPQLSHIPKKSMLFFDIETLGFHYPDPIFVIGTAKIMDGIDFSCFIARDYSEEAALVSHFFSVLDKHETYFTYNGTGFDIPRLEQRARDNLVRDGTRLQVEQKHIDLYELAKTAKKTLPNLRLQTFEKIILHHYRRDDIPGSKIPEVYHEFVYGKTLDGKDVPDDVAIDRMARVVKHNLLDNAVMICNLMYRCRD